MGSRFFDLYREEKIQRRCAMVPLKYRRGSAIKTDVSASGKPRFRPV